MAKVTVNGEIFDFDRDRKPLAEMLALEKAMDTTYGQWEEGLQAGSARALAGFVWLVWRRDGRDVKFSDIEDGTVEVNFAEFSLEDGEATLGPTTPTVSSTTGDGTSPRSARSASARGRSASST